jgi:hypothetical protein
MLITPPNPVGNRRGVFFYAENAPREYESMVDAVANACIAEANIAPLPHMAAPAPLRRR